MIKLNIKTRILTFVVLFQLIAYSTIQLFNNFAYKNELIQLKYNEIRQTFVATTEKINSQTLLLERNVTDLAITSEHLFALKQDDLLSLKQLEVEVERILTTNFSTFPEAIGGGIWFEPYKIDSSLKYFGPYAFQTEQGVKFSWDLNTPKYDYHNQSWYTMASANDWGQKKIVDRALFWTPPYFDEAGSYALMMTVDALIFDEAKQVIGITTVDRSLTELTSFLAKVSISENAYPFFIHKDSKQFLSYPKKPTLVMQEATQFDWGKRVLNESQVNKLNILTDVHIDGINYNIYFYGTNSGFIFGSLSPLSDIEKEIDSITQVTLLVGTSIGSIFLILLIIFMHVLFSPFDKVLSLIKNSISHREDDKNVVEIKHISYNKDNEFTPIIQALDEVYQQVSSYIDQITNNNVQLLQSKAEIDILNNELEEKVTLRTEQLEAKTQQALDSLTQLKNTQQQLIEQEKHASLGRLVAGVAHEINTPLGISITAASYMEDIIHEVFEKIEQGTLKKSEFSSKHKQLTESAQIVENNLKRTSDLVSSFKEVAVEQSSEEFKLFNLFDYLTKVTRSLQPRIEQAKHYLELTCTDSSIEVYSIPGAIAQVVNNLVENALLHGLSNINSGLIKVQLSKFEDSILIIVSDNGNGMSPEVVNSVFDPFFTASSHTSGSGLGMHIVYNLISQQLHGEISCESKLGQGTTVTISLPIQGR